MKMARLARVMCHRRRNRWQLSWLGSTSAYCQVFRATQALIFLFLCKRQGLVSPRLASSMLCSQGSPDFPVSSSRMLGLQVGTNVTSYHGECGSEAEAWSTLGLVQRHYILSLRNQALKFPFSLSGYPPSLSFFLPTLPRKDTPRSERNFETYLCFHESSDCFHFEPS